MNLNVAMFPRPPPPWKPRPFRTCSTAQSDDTQRPTPDHTLQQHHHQSILLCPALPAQDNLLHVLLCFKLVVPRYQYKHPLWCSATCPLQRLFSVVSGEGVRESDYFLGLFDLCCLFALYVVQFFYYAGWCPRPLARSACEYCTRYPIFLSLCLAQYSGWHVALCIGVLSLPPSTVALGIFICARSWRPFASELSVKCMRGRSTTWIKHRRCSPYNSNGDA